MPGFDGLGPRGQGPMTGRGMGYCAVPVTGESQSRAGGMQQFVQAPVSRGYWNPLGRNRRFSMGRGRGRGWGRGSRRGGGRIW